MLHQLSNVSQRLSLQINPQERVLKVLQALTNSQDWGTINSEDQMLEYLVTDFAFHVDCPPSKNEYIELMNELILLKAFVNKHRITKQLPDVGSEICQQIDDIVTRYSGNMKNKMMHPN